MTILDDSAVERARAVRLLLLDVDGVMTDGRFWIDSSGTELKAFHARDGLGIRFLQRAGIAVGIVSGRSSEAVAQRARELDIDELHLGVKDKLVALKDIVARRDLPAAGIAFAGDDLVDIGVMRAVGLAATVADCAAVVRRYAHVQTVASGGRGAVRELCEFILEAQGKWDEVLTSYQVGVA